ncbi:hypothetical protein BKH43_07905 [Helicobacter sp. 13S00401-1]|nr:hypothetical protein BKH43_07905 [Helicobacter sp. 13S00401-1]
MQPVKDKKGLFSYLPVSLFGSIMGLGAIAIAWHLASIEFPSIPEWIGFVIGIIATICLVILIICYFLKIATSFESFKQEWINPVTKPFFGTFFVSLLIMSIVIYHYNHVLAFIVWIIGAIGHTLFAIYTMNYWLTKKQEMEHITPAWIIPIVGLLDIPLGFRQFGDLFDTSRWGHDLSVFAFGVGMFYGIPVIVFIMNRLITHSNLASKILPTRMILMAPFAVAVSSYIEITMHIDLFSDVLYAIAIFTFIVLLPQIVSHLNVCPFRFSWWAISFPLAALAIAAFKISAHYPDKIELKALALLFLIVFSLAIIYISVRTLIGVFKGNLSEL